MSNMMTRQGWVEGYVEPVAADDVEAKAFTVAVKSDATVMFSPVRYSFSRWDLLTQAKVGEAFADTAERLACERLHASMGGTVRVVALVRVRGMGRYGRDCFDIPGVVREPATGLPMPATPALF